MTKELIYRLRKGYQGIALGSDDMGWVFDLDTINEAADAIEALTTRVCDLEEKYLVEKGMRRLATRERDAYGRINWQCSLGSFQRFVPLQLVPAPPQPIYSTPIGRTMELFA